ncbi:MAG TPA: ABC transporter permease [Edaphobacter sp.]|nr:ABC transporter permease [Edaphobacter sp.]
MSDKAMNARVVEAADLHSAGRTVETEIAARRPRGPGALRTTMLLAGVTFREAARRKILWIATLGGAAFLALFWTGLHAMLKSMAPHMNAINRREGVNMMIMMVLYAGSMMTSLMAALTSCDTLSGEIASGTIHAIATKPVRRWCLVLGKWVGFVGMLTLYVLFVEGGTIGIGWFEGSYLPPHSAAVLGLIWLQAVLLLSVTMACSTRLSALTSGAVALGLYGVAFVGGWIEQFGALRHVKTCVDLGIVSSLIMPSDALWRRAAFRIQPPLIGAAGASPFSSTLVPSPAMVVYAVLYALLALFVAQILFEGRDL